MSSERSNLSLTALYIGVPVLIGASCYYLYVSRSSSSKDTSGDKAKAKKLSPAEQLTQFRQIGNQNFSRKNYDLAIHHYTNAIEFSKNLSPQECRPDELAIFYQNLAACNEALCQYDQVVANCDRAIELKSNYTKAYLRRAKAYEKLENYEKAMVDAFSANLLEKFQNQGSMILTDNIVRASSKRKAIEAMKSHTPAWPSNQTIKSYFSAFTQDPIKDKVENGIITKPEHLQPLLDEAIKPDNDNDPLSLLIRGSCQSLMGQLKEAQVSFDKLLSLPDEECPVEFKANALIKKAAIIISDPASLSSLEKDIDYILVMLDQAAKLDPENPDVYLHKAQTLMLEDRLNDAVISLEKAISLKSDFHSAIAQKFYIEFKMASRDASLTNDKLQDFLERFKAVVKENPESSDLLGMHAQILTELSYFEQADQVLLEIAKLDPTDPSAYLSRALLQFHLKSDPDEVATLLKEALRVDPKTIFAYEILGSIETQRGRIDEAIGIFEKALEHAQSEAEYERCYSLLDSAISQRAASEVLGMQI